MSATAALTPPVRRRRLLYVSGFDPRSPAHYHRLYRAGAEAQARVSGHQIQVGPRRHDGPWCDHWQVQARIEGHDCDTQVDFLRWDDLIRQHWPAGHAAYLRGALSVTARLVANGVLWRLLRTSRPAFQACIGAGFVTSTLLLLASLLIGLTAAAWQAWGAVGGAAVSVLATLGMVGLAWLSRHAERAWYLGWVLRGLAFTTRQARDGTPEMTQRLEAFADHLQACMADPSLDEVLVVGHSLGTMQAASVIARWMAREPARAMDPRLSLLTLGQSFPVQAYQPGSRAFRAELVRVADALGHRWIDITAPADRCCTALVDPTEAAHGFDGLVARQPPRRLTPQFPKLFSAERYAALRQDLFEMHFQYLKASDLPGPYDYFALSAGPQRLADRFASQRDAGDFTALQCLGGPFPGLRRPSRHP